MQLTTKDAAEARSASQSDLLFISLDWSRPKDLRRPLAMASIEAYFRKNQAENLKAEFRSFNLNAPKFNIQDVLKTIGETLRCFSHLGAIFGMKNIVQM